MIATRQLSHRVALPSDSQAVPEERRTIGWRAK